MQESLIAARAQIDLHEKLNRELRAKRITCFQVIVPKALSECDVFISCFCSNEVLLAELGDFHWVTTSTGSWSSLPIYTAMCPNGITYNFVPLEPFDSKTLDNLNLMNEYA